MEQTEEAFNLRILFRDFAIEQLHNFINIRTDLITDSNFIKLDNIIKEIIEPILKYEEPIKKLRNNYVAHIQEQRKNFKVTMYDIFLEYTMPPNPERWYYLCGLEFYYFGFVRINFKKEFDCALKLYSERIHEAFLIAPECKINDINIKISKILKSITPKLVSNGYKIFDDD